MAPRLEINLDRIHRNATTLVERLGRRGISVTGVNKATLGSAPIARELLRAGIPALGDSRIENVESLRHAGIDAPITLLRSPMLSQCDRVVASADVSMNTEPAVLARLSDAASTLGRRHGVVLMVELGDLREGILPDDLAGVVASTLRMPGIELQGIGANLACHSGVSPDQRNMDELSSLADAIEQKFGIELAIVSGGNSANLEWALTTDDVGRINDLRLGESILLGRETLHRQPIEGLALDAFTLVAEVIEAKVKPGQPWGDICETAFGPAVVNPGVAADRVNRVIVAIGRQDVDPDGITPPPGFTIVGASSDHLVLVAHGDLPAVGAELRFDLDYSALLRSMTSPYLAQVLDVA